MSSAHLLHVHDPHAGHRYANGGIHKGVATDLAWWCGRVLCRERVRQVEAGALEHLRATFGAARFESFDEWLGHVEQVLARKAAA